MMAESKPLAIEIIGSSKDFTVDTANDDTSSQYVQRRDDASAAAALEGLRREFAGSEEPSEQLPPPAPGDTESEAPSIGKAVLKDVARGATEMPGQIVRGAQAAVQETIDMFLSAGNWLEKKFPITPGHEGGEAEFKIPELVGEADSTTGKMVKDMAQFLTGFAGAGKLKLIKALQPTTKVGAAGKAGAKGAISDFTAMDPMEDKLSDFIEKHPGLSNPVTAFLAADPDDLEITRRLKRAAEGLGLGALTEGFIGAVSAMRAGRKARAEARVANPEEVPIRVTKADIDALIGDSEGKLIITRKAEDPAVGKVEKGLKKTKPGDLSGDTNETFINFARINAPEDVQKVMQQMADAHKGDVDVAKRGVRTWEQTKASAEQVQVWDELMARRKGEPLNAEQTQAARQLWVSSASKLSEVADLAARMPSDGNLVAFRKMLATHYAIQKEVLAARTETARALNAWKIPAGDDAMLARGLESMLADSGGLETNRMLAQRVAALAKAGYSRELEKMVEGGVFAKTREAVAQVWINALLTNPATHVVNTVSNWTVIGQQIAERRVAQSLSETFGSEGGVAVGEAMAQLTGITAGFKDAMRAAWKTLKTGEATGPTKIEGQRGGPGALSAEAWQIANETPMGQALDLLDATTRVPGRLLATSDEFFKGIGYRMELNAQAHRMAVDEVAQGLPADQLKRRVAEIIDNPPDHIRIEAVDAALYQTFTQKPAEVLGKLADAWQRIPILGILTMPFKRTPINILTYAAERSPAAPLVKAWREDLAAGGARADLATARMATGSMVVLAAIDAAMSGNITGKGPTNPAERQNWMRQGNQEYSIKLGERQWSFNRLDPIGMTIGLGADIAAAIVNADKQMEKGGETYNAMEEAIQASMFAIAKNVTSKNYMSGMAQFFDAISDPDRHGERFGQRLSGSMVPAGVASAARQVDPFMRVAETNIEAMQKRLPFWSESLPMYRDLWGRPVDYRSGAGMMYDIFSPVYTKKYQPEPIDAEMKRLEHFAQMPEKKITVNGVVLDLEQYPFAYERYVELAGNELKHPAWNVGAKDLLNSVVEGKHPLSAGYNLLSGGPDGGKAQQLQAWMAEYRRLARDELIKEFSDLRTEYEAKRKPFGNKYDPALFGN